MDPCAAIALVLQSIPFFRRYHIVKIMLGLVFSVAVLTFSWTHSGVFAPQREGTLFLDMSFYLDFVVFEFTDVAVRSNI